MYYEEKQIDGVWYWRGAPDDDWTPFNATKLYQKLAQKDARIAELEKALREIVEFKPGTFWGLEDEIKIHQTAKKALGL